MLRASNDELGTEIEIGDVTAGLRNDTSIPEAETLNAFAEAVFNRDQDEIARLRNHIVDRLGPAAAVDAAAIAAAFHGFVRVADAIGIPYEGAAAGTDSTELRSEAGINDFYKIKELEKA